MFSATLKRVRERQKARFSAWMNRRIPAAREVTLDQKRIFIFPSRTGLFFLLVLLLMLVASINYQNNMGFALTFLLGTVFVIGVLHTYANLSGLTLRAVRAAPVFAGQLSEFELLVSRPHRRQHYSLNFRWCDETATINLDHGKEAEVKLYLLAPQRGWYNPGRLSLQSYYPLGLIRTWTWIDLDIHALVYPRPVQGPVPAGDPSDFPDGDTIPVIGSDDFYGLKDYQQGDSLKHVYWKSVAKGQPLQSKQYNAYADRSVWLDWDSYQGLPIETRLSHLCYWVLHFDAEGEEYGMRLPGFSADPGSGEEHRDLLLRQLALFCVEPESGTVSGDSPVEREAA